MLFHPMHLLLRISLYWNANRVCWEAKTHIGENYHGILKWSGVDELKGKIRWVKSEQGSTVFGLEFDSTNGTITELKIFCESDKFQRMRLINHDDFSVETPADLKYWLKSDGRVKYFLATPRW